MTTESKPPIPVIIYHKGLNKNIPPSNETKNQLLDTAKKVGMDPSQISNEPFVTPDGRVGIFGGQIETEPTTGKVYATSGVIYDGRSVRKRKVVD